MRNMYNLGTVIKFEIMRMLKKFSFWAMALGFPLMILTILTSTVYVYLRYLM